MKTGIEIKTTWTNCASFEMQGEIPNFVEDSQTMCRELFGVLKDFCLLPKLRKENLHVESNLNTIHQTYMYDLLYDQQDVYDYYNEIFEERENSLDRNVRVRQPHQPFSLALENFDEVLSQFSCDNEFRSLASIRWYSQNGLNDFPHEKDSLLNKNFNSEVYSITSTAAYSDIFTSLKLNINSHMPNQLLSLLNSLTLTLSFFCRMSYDYISLFSNEEKLFLDCFLKMYKAYVSAAILMNDNFENLNVIVNYVYETHYKEGDATPKFSIYRLMLITWHRLVTIPLSDIKREKNLIEASLKFFKTFIVNEFEKNNEHLSLNCFSYYKSKSDPPETFGEKKHLQLDFMSDDENSYYNKINLHNQCLNFSLGSEYIKSGDNLKYDLDVNPNLNPSQQAQYFLEGIPSVFLDLLCNEYSTFHINDSEFPVSHLYQIYEKHLIKIIEKFVKSKLVKVDALTVLNYFINSEFFSTKLINRTRKIVIDSITTIIQNHLKEEITHLFLSYINTYSFDGEEVFRDIEMVYRVYDFTQERSNMFYSDFLQLSLDKFRNQSIAEYAVISFLRELTKGKNMLYHALSQTLVFIQEEKENREYIDKQVKKETKRRNILIHNNVNYQGQFYNFNINISFEHILELYNCSNYILGLTYQKHEEKIDNFNGNMQKPIEDMPTLPQSLDIDMKIDDTMMDVEYDNNYNSYNNYLMSMENQFR